MGIYLAKIKGINDRWYKLLETENSDYSVLDLSDAMEYDPNNRISDQWFKITDFNNNSAFMAIFSQIADGVDCINISRKQYSLIEFIAYYESPFFYIQYVQRNKFLAKKWLSFNTDVVSYNTDSSIIYLSNIPTCIYNHEEKTLYFQNISKAYSIFRDLRNDYKEATAVEVESFMSDDMIEMREFEAEKVGISNRKRISSVLQKFRGYTPEQKLSLKTYIKDNVAGTLEYINGRFVISNDSQLRILLYGIQQRLFIPPLSEDREPNVATAVTKISNLI